MTRSNLAVSMMAPPRVTGAAKGVAMASDDVMRKVLDVLDRWVAAWNAADTAAMAALFREDAH